MIDSKQIAMNLFETNRKEFLKLARLAAERIYHQRGHVTTDDVRKEVKLPRNIDGRVFGAVFNKRWWRKVGYKATDIPTSHGRSVAIWQMI